MKKRWGVGGAVLGIGLLLTSGTFAAHAAAPTVVIDSPAQDESVKVDPVIKGSASMPNNGTVTGGTVTVTPADEAHGPAQSQSFGSGQPSVSFELTFDFAWNGVYTASASAVGNDRFDFNGPEQSPVVQRTFKLEQPPVAPANVTTAVDEEKRIVTITWDANPEPDIAVYCLTVNTKFMTCVKGDKTSFSHELKQLPAGKYEYAVRAYREDADPGDDNYIEGPQTKDSVTVKSAPPPPPATGTPTTQAGSGATGGATAPGSRPPTSAPGGKVNLSAFGNLLGDRSELPLPPRQRADNDVDTGFERDLPFGSPNAAIVGDDDAGQELDATPASSGDSRPQELLFLAAGLLVTVILMHVLWIKSEVDRTPLEAVAPEPDANVVSLDRARRTAA